MQNIREHSEHHELGMNCLYSYRLTWYSSGLCWWEDCSC